MRQHPDLRAALARAFARAAAARRPPGIYDLFAALVESPDVHLMIHQTGADADLLAATLGSAVAAVPVPRPIDRLRTLLAPDPSIARVLALASRSRAAGDDEVGPAQVFAAGFEMGDAALVALLEGGGLSRAGVAQWLSDASGVAAAPLPAPAPPARSGFLRSLTARLMWRMLPPDDASSSDAVIAVCGGLALAVWVVGDRYVAGPSPHWYPGGLAGVAWYAVGLLTLAWVLHRVSAASGGFRAVLAPLVGCLPLALVIALAFQAHVPDGARGPGVLVLVCLGVLHVRRVLASTDARWPRAAVVAGSTLVAIFAWGTERAAVRPHVWFTLDADDDELAGWDQSERLLFEQSDRIDSAARLAPGDPGRPAVFFLGFAGTGEQKVFAEETKLAARVISERYGAVGRTLLLLNDRRDLETQPLATVHGLRRALRRVGERMDPSRDVLFLFLTSHGSVGSLAVSNSTWPLEQLAPPALRQALDDSRIKWRVIVVSACYSGSFIPALASEESAVFTSAAAYRTSFGCSDDRDVTEFGAAFIRDALPGAPNLTAAFDRARVALAAEERRRGLAESLPQSRVGAAFAAHWSRVEAQHGVPPKETHP